MSKGYASTWIILKLKIITYVGKNALYKHSQKNSLYKHSQKNSLYKHSQKNSLYKHSQNMSNAQADSFDRYIK